MEGISVTEKKRQQTDVWIVRFADLPTGTEGYFVPPCLHPRKRLHKSRSDFTYGPLSF
jgi:hypothetical protein